VVGKYAIIGGTGRAGSTSLFRYLSDHPEVCGSSVKETKFFIRAAADPGSASLEDYKTYYHCYSNDAKILLEATPAYLHRGKDIAPVIARLIPDARFIFILRDPVIRFHTIYRNHCNENWLNGASFDEFTSLALEHYSRDLLTNTVRGEKLSPGECAARLLRTGCYARFLPEFFKHFPQDNICILFFENLLDCPATLVKNTARFLKIDPAFFNNYSFSIANKTRDARWKAIYQIALRMNRRFESTLNQHPDLRRLLLGIYHGLNVSKTDREFISDETFQRLHSFFAPFNHELFALLQHHPVDTRFPTWVGKGMKT